MGTGPERPKARRKLRLGVERLEGRDLPTAPALLAGTVAPVHPGSTLSQTQAAAAVPPEPTPHELARQKFVAKFSGSFITGPPRFTDQASQTFIQGGGTSSAFLHADLQMGVYTPVDPNHETTGIAALIPKNVSNSGNILVFDLQGDTTSLDRMGRPTRFTWTVDSSSGGTFSGSTGEGTVEIRYWRGGKLPPRAWSAGGAGVIFRGRIETNGVTGILR
jgi:hypothetical protein